MSRTARLVVPNYPHHVTQRGARKQKTFFSSHDYKMYLELLRQARENAGVEVWAYCLMPNHVHLVVVPSRKDSLAAFFRQAHRTYTLIINAREGWQGHLWQERFHSFVMDEKHLLAAVRYTELNPVRAGLCNTPDEWPWSSFRAHLVGIDDKLVTTRPMLDRIDNWKQYVCAEYQNNERLTTLREHSRNGRPAGNDAFVRELEHLVGRSLKKRKPGRPKKVIE
jgi:putative transposase